MSALNNNWSILTTIELITTNNTLHIIYIHINIHFFYLSKRVNK